jgi:hypothetical protein
MSVYEGSGGVYEGFNRAKPILFSGLRVPGLKIETWAPGM